MPLPSESDNVDLLLAYLQIWKSSTVALLREIQAIVTVTRESKTSPGTPRTPAFGS
jgi:hypothetical protein